MSNFDYTQLRPPGVYVNVIPPAPVFNGVDSSMICIVGSADWGPLNVPVYGSYSDLIQSFGIATEDPHDLMTQCYAAHLQNADNFIGIRVADNGARVSIGKLKAGDDTDATDIKALYNGELGNAIKVQISDGIRGLFKLSVLINENTVEVFDSLADWPAIVDAVNKGTTQRGASTYIDLYPLYTTTVPPVKKQIASLAEGESGRKNVTSTTLVGSDEGEQKTGMYVAHNTGAFYLVLSGADDPTTWSEQAAFAKKNNILAIVSGVEGQTITQAIAALLSAGIVDEDAYAIKVMIGDYCQVKAPTTRLFRYINSAGLLAGVKASMLPSECSLNKEVRGVFNTQHLNASGFYSSSNILQMMSYGLDVLSIDPSFSSSIFTFLTGHNVSRDTQQNDDSYSTLVPYIAKTLVKALTPYRGKLMSPSNIDEILTATSFFLDNLQQEGVIGTLDNTPAYKIKNIKAENRTLTFDVFVSRFSIMFVIVANLQVNAATTSSYLV